MHYRGFTIERTADANYRVPALEGGAVAVTLATAKRWIDCALAVGELREPTALQPKKEGS
jgi:hypothetical protein